MKSPRTQNSIAAKLVCSLALLGAVVPVHAQDMKPNIVHIVADDLGWMDVGFNGCTD